MVEARSDQNGVEELAEKVNELQRSDPKATERWVAHCQSREGDIRDPQKHEASSLQSFLNDYPSDRGRSPSSEKDPPTSKVFIGGLPEHCDSRRLFRHFQVYGPILECVVMADRGSGIVTFESIDSAEDVLEDSDQHQIDGIWCGVRSATPQDRGPTELSELVKEGQRKCLAWKEVWSMYCNAYGGGLNDPLRHEGSFIVGFLDFLGLKASKALEYGVDRYSSSRGGGSTSTLGEPLAKRTRSIGTAVESYERDSQKPDADKAFTLNLFLTQAESARTDNSSGHNSVHYTENESKHDLVLKVKGWQRQGGEKLAQWQAYADRYLGGIRDPNRHDVSQLHKFFVLNSDLQNEGRWARNGDDYRPRFEHQPVQI